MIEKHRDNIYLNLTINPDPSVGERNTVAVFDQTLSTPVINDPSQYFCSVIRFSLPLSEVPLFKFPLDVNQNIGPTSWNNSYLIIGVTNAGIQFPQRVVYVPNNNLTPPTPALVAPFYTNDQSISDYYNIFSITHFIDMINTALAAAVVAAGLAVTAPFYSWNPQTELISLTVSAAYIATGSTIFMNKYMQNYLSSFNLTYNATTFQYTHRIPAGAGPFTIQQDYISISLWFDIRKVILQSKNIPVTPESVPSQNVNNISQLGLPTGLNAWTPILTDFIVSYDDANQIKSIIVYNPQPQYRLIDMTSQTPLQKIDLQFFYLDKFGNKFPIYISPSQQATVKLGFFKKHLYH